MNYVDYFEKRNLLTSGKSNTKTAKNSRETYYLSLQPTDLNSKGMNLCKFSTKECRKACLQFAGRQSFSNVVISRERKTEYLVNHRKEFVEKLWKELSTLNSKKVAVRLNLLSDINWNEELEAVVGKAGTLKNFNNIQFYDYTKDHIKALNNKIKNYHLTLSYSGHNWKQCEEYLNKGGNVAVVFKNALPAEYNGFKVIDGDASDERYLDKKGVIVGLKYKTPKGVKYEQNKFVVE